MNLPDGWEIKRLSQLIKSMDAGISLNSENRKAKKGELGILKTSAVTAGVFNSDENKVIETSEIGRTKIFPIRNRIIMSRMNTPALVGASAFIPKTRKDLFLPDRLWQLTPQNDSANMRWLSFVLGSPKYRAKLTSFATGTSDSMKNITKNDVKSLLIVLPPFSEQKAIANLLSTWDEAIDKIERLIQAKEKIFHHTANYLLFGHRRSQNIKYSLAESIFFKYPSDWKLVKIGMIAKEINQRNEDTNMVVLSCSKYDGFVDSLAYFGKQVFSNDTSNYKVVKKGQFGYPCNHVEEGSIGLLNHCEKGIVSPIYVVFDVDKEKVHPEYLFKLLKTRTFQHIFQVTTSASVSRRGSLRWKNFSKIKIPLPPIEEQKQIAETLNLAQKEINLLKQLAEKYKLQKRGLMQKLLTGEWRVEC